MDSLIRSSQEPEQARKTPSNVVLAENLSLFHRSSAHCSIAAAAATCGPLAVPGLTLPAGGAM